LLEKEFKDRHRGDLSRSRFIYAKQSEHKAKVHPPDRKVCRHKRGAALEIPGPQVFNQDLHSWKTQLMFQGIGLVSSSPHVRQGSS
jgi:hypothetical protein